MDRGHENNALAMSAEGEKQAIGADYALGLLVVSDMFGVHDPAMLLSLKSFD